MSLITSQFVALASIVLIIGTANALVENTITNTIKADKPLSSPPGVTESKMEPSAMRSSHFQPLSLNTKPQPAPHTQPHKQFETLGYGHGRYHGMGAHRRGGYHGVRGRSRHRRGYRGIGGHSGYKGIGGHSGYHGIGRGRFRRRSHMFRGAGRFHRGGGYHGIGSRRYGGYGGNGYHRYQRNNYRRRPRRHRLFRRVYGATPSHSYRSHPMSYGSRRSSYGGVHPMIRRRRQSMSYGGHSSSSGGYSMRMSSSYGSSCGGSSSYGYGSGSRRRRGFRAWMSGSSSSSGLRRHGSQHGSSGRRWGSRGGSGWRSSSGSYHHSHDSHGSASQAKGTLFPLLVASALAAVLAI